LEGKKKKKNEKKPGGVELRWGRFRYWNLGMVRQQNEKEDNGEEGKGEKKRKKTRGKGERRKNTKDQNS